MSISQSLYIFSLVYAIAVETLSITLMLLRYRDTRMRGYLAISSFLIILLVSYLFLYTSAVTGLTIYYTLTVYVISFTFLPPFLYFRYALSDEIRKLLDYFYLGILSLKIYDLYFWRVYVLVTRNSIELSRPRGLLGSLSYVIESFILFSIIVWLLIESSRALRFERSKSILALTLMIVATYTFSITIYLLSDFSITPAYHVAIMTSLLLGAIIFYREPIILSFIPLKLEGIILADSDGDIILILPLGIGAKELREVFKNLSILRGEKFFDEPVEIEINKSKLIIVPNHLEGLLILYGRNLDMVVYEYIKQRIENLGGRIMPFIEEMQSKLL